MNQRRLPALALAATCVLGIITSGGTDEALGIRSGLLARSGPAMEPATLAASHGGRRGDIEGRPSLDGGAAVLAASPASLAGALAAARTQYQGFAGWAAPSHGKAYLAMREPRGTRVLIGGSGGTWTATVNDWGPSSHIRPVRVADIAVGQWERICGVPRRFGLCNVSVTILSRPSRERAAPVGPETSVE